jgi:hypothetical protein
MHKHQCLNQQLHQKMNIVHSIRKKDKGMFRFFLVSAFAFRTMFSFLMEIFGEQCYFQDKYELYKILCSIIQPQPHRSLGPKMESFAITYSWTKNKHLREK